MINLGEYGGGGGGGGCHCQSMQGLGLTSTQPDAVAWSDYEALLDAYNAQGGAASGTPAPTPPAQPSIIKGVPNTYLILGVMAVIGLVVISKQ